MSDNPIMESMRDLYDKINNLISRIVTAESNNTGGFTGELTASRGTISGGYKVVGKRCFVQAVFTANQTLTGNDYWSIGSGFPVPVDRYAALSAARPFGQAPTSAYVNNGTLQIVTGNQSVASGILIIITGSYITV